MTALAAPVDAGMMFSRMPRPKRQSLPETPSTTFCVAVVAWTVVMRPRLMPKESSSTLASGREAVRRARRGRDDRLARVPVRVDAVDEHRRVVLRRRRDDDAPGAGAQVRLGLVLGQEDAGRLDDDVDADVAPRRRRRILHRRSRGWAVRRRRGIDPSPSDSCRNLPCTESCLSRYARCGSSSRSFTATTSTSLALHGRAERHPADATESVDADLDHAALLSSLSIPRKRA